MDAVFEKIKVVVICGPTGSGKTSLAVHLAQELRGEIISADSMQIYRYMDIGTAKPTPSEQSLVSHHLIDVVDPDAAFDAAKFVNMATAIIRELDDSRKVPLIVGGTGLYIKALIHGLFMEGLSNATIRNRLKRIALDKGAGFLYDRLCECDPVAAERIHPNDTIRIVRALEIYEHTGKTISQYHREHGFSECPFHALKIGLTMPRERLYSRIDDRVDAMIEAGLLDEVKRLLDQGYSQANKSMLSIGYRHMTDYIGGRVSWDETIRIMKRDTRRYAKRQMTWFKADPEITWFEPEQKGSVKQMVLNFLQSA
ncbi:MAG: tRNA (adenosine(37)-N6)-dimethylallyltransferase MiaA [Desulfobacterales bacterium]|nr:tRNA (adenosine(37)-N6)-dimethylallyltransferase MiaA [Desulfobacterales bacterium]MDD4072713.1 tRNA (adenosine(37)-N6)-dimethylallyltransferase MiaA [Desulfobacterales bacterium]MDD4392280.1 tRNA (adenosine(37)-N6)-dimethylallyltransferase MiaA [Desulfobacterales bacterium]